MAIIVRTCGIIIGRVTEHDLSNITVGGKIIFVPSEKRNTAWLNFPAGSVAKVTFDKGTATSIAPPSPEEMATFTRDELAGKPIPEPTAAPVKPTAKINDENRRILLDLLKNDPEIRAKIREIQEASS